MAPWESLTPGEKGAAAYSGWVLWIYDFWVLGIVNSYAWRCPTRKHLLPLLQENIGLTHLDVGVGTGWYLKEAQVSPETDLTLWDLNPTALREASRRLQRTAATKVCDITKPVEVSKTYDSVSMFFLLHCLPGPIEKKLGVIENVKQHMTPDGVLTGATVLGKGVEDGLFGSIIRRFVEWDGIMNNRTDDAKSIESALNRHFEDVHVEIVGVVLLFRARRRK
ncbi:MAG: hypothetical protein M1828_000917 [Chrysothrix sp. TS-e1954]|nr:MAG: hypothetical protein M1828_000917 [Chrysothrix sp. TS-e1954]